MVVLQVGVCLNESAGCAARYGGGGGGGGARRTRSRWCSTLCATATPRPPFEPSPTVYARWVTTVTGGGASCCASLKHHRGYRCLSCRLSLPAVAATIASPSAAAARRCRPHRRPPRLQSARLWPGGARNAASTRCHVAPVRAPPPPPALPAAACDCAGRCGAASKRGSASPVAPVHSPWTGGQAVDARDPVVLFARTLDFAAANLVGAKASRSPRLAKRATSPRPQRPFGGSARRPLWASR
eukprot:ctg_1899.g571